MADDGSYCVDTSSLIECWTRYYPIDVFPGLWDRLEALALNGGIVAPDEVLNEIRKKQDGLYAWAKSRGKMFLPLDGDIQAATTDVLRDNPLLAKEFAQRTHADPFVIAVAKLRTLSIVTQEGPGSSKRPTIPYVCGSLGIRCVTVVEFIRANGWSFS